MMLSVTSTVLRLFETMTPGYRDQERFIRERTSGRLAPRGSKGGEVGPRTVARDLKFLHAVLNWAVLAGDGKGGFLLFRNPLKGLPLPREKSPRRPQLSQESYEALLDIAGDVDLRFKAALVVAHETGHRIGAIASLRWSDLDLDGGWVRWGKQSDKIGLEHLTPLTQEAVEAFRELQKVCPGIGEAWVFPSPEDPSKPCSRHLFGDWWPKGEGLAGLPHEKGMGWHSLRRKFATELKDTPLKDICQLGGWKSPQTVLTCYQQPDQDTMRRSLEARRPIRTPSKGPNRQYESTVSR